MKVKLDSFLFYSSSNWSRSYGKEARGSIRRHENLSLIRVKAESILFLSQAMLFKKDY